MMGSILSAILLLVSLQALTCFQFSNNHGRNRQIIYQSAVADDEESHVRSMLDEAVSLFQASLDHGSSTHEAEHVVCELGKVLYETTVHHGDNALLSISEQLDQTVVEASRDASLLPQVEALAIKYHQLAERRYSEISNQSGDLMNQAILSDSRLRLDKLKQAIDDDVEEITSEEGQQPNDIKQAEFINTLPLDYSSSENSQSQEQSSIKADEVDQVDVAIVGAGIGGLCAGAILNTLYGKKVGIYESHYLAGGCAHAFTRAASNGEIFTFDSGPTILLGCSTPPFNPLRQVLDAIDQPVDWIRYEGWGMIENPKRKNELRWKVELGENLFQTGPLKKFGGDKALQEFEQLRKATAKLVRGAASIPAMAMRAGKSALIPLLRYLPALLDLIQQGEKITQGTFEPYMNGPIFTVTDPWLRSWLDALAFSLSGLPASRTSAAAMAYVLYDMHRPDAALDYPKGGMGAIIDALVRGVEQGDNGSKVYLRSHVESIDARPDGLRITGLTLTSGKQVKAREGVICNAPVWSLNGLIKDQRVRDILDSPAHSTARDRKPRSSWVRSEARSFIGSRQKSAKNVKTSLLYKCDTAEMTGSFLHLHIAINADGLNLDEMQAHYTVMDRGLLGDGSKIDGPCGELNMIAVSNPCVIDRSLAPAGYIVLHAYGAANEPYEIWKDGKRTSSEYLKLKEKRCEVLWRAIESIVPDARNRTVLQLVGSPLTHERFLRRPQGSYGAATEDYLNDGGTAYEGLLLAGDGVFPGIGVPSVALSGAAAANSFASPVKQWRVLDELKRKRRI